MTRPPFVVFLAVGVASAFHAGGLVRRPVATVARHASNVAIADEVPSSVARGVVSSASSKRRRSRRGGRNRRRSSSSSSSDNTAKRTDPLSSTPYARPNSRRAALTQARTVPSPFEVTVHSPLKLAISALKPLRLVLNPWRTRALLLAVWRRGRAGGRGEPCDRCIDLSIAECCNDFELVTRATKEVEHILEAYFDTPCGKAASLPVKIRLARTADGEPLSAGLIKRMKHLMKVRNALVHRRHVNAITHRRAFVEHLEEVLRELATETDRIQRQRQGLVAGPPARKVDAVASELVPTGTGAQVLPAGTRIVRVWQRRAAELDPGRADSTEAEVFRA